MKRTQALWLIVCLGVLLGVSATAGAAGLYDGTWEGTTSEDFAIVFTIEDDVVTSFEYTTCYDCPVSVTQTCWGHARAPHTRLLGSYLIITLEITPGAGITGGAEFPAVIIGQFASETACQGMFRTFHPAFSGEGASTQVCTGARTWSASKVAAADSQSVPEEYSIPLN